MTPNEQKRNISVTNRIDPRLLPPKQAHPQASEEENYIARIARERPFATLPDLDGAIQQQTQRVVDLQDDLNSAVSRYQKLYEESVIRSAEVKMTVQRAENAKEAQRDEQEAERLEQEQMERELGE